MGQENKHKNPLEKQIIPSDIIYPDEIEHTKKFCDIELFFRALKPDDEPMLEKFLYQLSEESAYQRFFQIMKTFPEEFIHEMVSLDYHEKMGIRGFEASVIVGNNAMMSIFKNSGCILHTKFDSGMYSLNYYFDEKI